jgi:hypothetical protein
MKKNPKKPSALMSASTVLQSLLGSGKSPLSDQFTRWKLWRYWEEIVGANLSKICIPVELDKGKLLIWARSSAALQDLHYVSEGIKDEVNKFLGKRQVVQIRYTLDESKVPPAGTASHDFGI